MLKNKIALVTYPRSGRSFMIDILTSLYDGLTIFDVDQGKCHPQSHREVHPPEADVITSHDFARNERYPDHNLVCMARDPFEAMASLFELRLKRGEYEDTAQCFRKAAREYFVPWWKTYIQKYGIMSRAEQPRVWINYDGLIRHTLDNVSLVLDINKDVSINVKAYEKLATTPAKRRHDYLNWRHYTVSNLNSIKLWLGDTFVMARGLGLV